MIMQDQAVRFRIEMAGGGEKMSSKPTVFNYQEYVGLKGKYEDLKMENKEMADRINTLHEVIDRLLKERTNLEIKVRILEERVDEK